MSSAITGKEMAAIPPKDRVYTCQQCGKVSMQNEQFRLIQFLGIAFVICFDCILGDQKVELEREAAAKALTDAAHQFATQDGLEVLMFARDDIAAVRVTERWLLDRAAEYRREETE